MRKLLVAVLVAVFVSVAGSAALAGDVWPGGDSAAVGPLGDVWPGGD